MPTTGLQRIEITRNGVVVANKQRPGAEELVDTGRQDRIEADEATWQSLRPWGSPLWNGGRRQARPEADTAEWRVVLKDRIRPRPPSLIGREFALCLIGSAICKLAAGLVRPVGNKYETKWQSRDK